MKMKTDLLQAYADVTKKLIEPTEFTALDSISVKKMKNPKSNPKITDVWYTLEARVDGRWTNEVGCLRGIEGETIREIKKELHQINFSWAQEDTEFRIIKNIKSVIPIGDKMKLSDFPL